MLRNRTRRLRPGRVVVPVLLASFALAGGTAAAQTPAASPAPEQPSVASAPTGARLEVEQSEIDLGAIVRGEIAEARFALHNRGDEIAHVLRVKPG